MHEMAIRRLVQLRAFVEVESHSEEGKKETNEDGKEEKANKGGGFIVHEHFRKHVKRAIERGFEDLDDEEEEKENEGEKKKKKANVKTTTNTTTTTTSKTTTTRFNEDAGFLDHYAKIRWETVLLELTSEASVEKKRKKKKMMKKKGDGGVGAQHALHLRKLFYAARLITKDGRITSEGFSFLLGATSEQIWILLARYARGGDFEKKMKNKTTNEENGEGDKMETNGEDEKEQHKLKSDESSAAAMAFLVRLSFQHPGRKYSKANLSEAERRVASHLSALGVLYENEDDENDNNWYVQKQREKTGTENDEQRSVGKRIKIYLVGVFNNRRKTEKRSRGSRREGFKAIDGGTE